MKKIAMTLCHQPKRHDEKRCMKRTKRKDNPLAFGAPALVAPLMPEAVAWQSYEKLIEVTSLEVEDAVNAFGRPGYDPSVGMVRGKTRPLHEIPDRQELNEQSASADSDQSHSPEIELESTMGAKMQEQEVINPGALVVAKALSLISLVVAVLSGCYLIFQWSFFDTEMVDRAFKASLVLMLVAMAFNGHAYQKSE